MSAIKSFAVVSGLLLAKVSAFGFDFHYSYSDVFQPSAETYLVSQSNVQRVDEGIVHYYCPITLGVPASLTYRFSLGGTISVAHLFAHGSSYNFGNGNSGFGSLWGSTDGSTWQLLMDLPTPAGIDAGYFYDQNLPASLLGSTDIWIQARMQSSGSSIMSQFSRTDIRFPTQVFRFDATIVPEPSTVSILTIAVFGLGLLKGSNPKQ